MINWIKNLFTPKYSCDNLPKFQGTYAPMLECKPPKQNISEPVYAIERSMIEHPSRWKVSFTESNILTSRYFCTVEDIKNNLKFCGHVIEYYGYVYEQSDSGVTITTTVLLDWATEDEKNYLVNAVRNMQDKKRERVERIRQVKKNKERQRLMEIYK